MRNRKVFSASLRAGRCQTTLRRLTFGAGDKLENPLWLLHLRGKKQHRQIKASLANFWTRLATLFFFAISFPFLYLWHTHCIVYLLGFIQIWTDVQKRILHCCAQTSDILHELSVDNRRQLYSQPLQCNKKIDFTPASFSLISSAPSGVIFEDLISHIRTSSFLTRAQEGCLDPFHMRKPRPAQIATLKRIIISFKSFLHIYFWLLWERCISFSYTFKLNKLGDRRENRPRDRILNKNIFNPMFLSNGGPLVW